MEPRSRVEHLGVRAWEGDGEREKSESSSRRESEVAMSVQSMSWVFQWESVDVYRSI